MSVHEVVPFLAVKDMEKSTAFYVDGLGFAFRNKWVKASAPRVGNGLWVTGVRDPDGFELNFQSPTDVAEGTRLSASSCREDTAGCSAS